MTNFERWKKIITPEQVAGYIANSVYYCRRYASHVVKDRCYGCPLGSNKPGHNCRKYVDLAIDSDECEDLLSAWFKQECLRKEAK